MEDFDNEMFRKTFSNIFDQYKKLVHIVADPSFLFDKITLGLKRATEKEELRRQAVNPLINFLEIDKILKKYLNRELKNSSRVSQLIISSSELSRWCPPTKEKQKEETIYRNFIRKIYEEGENLAGKYGRFNEEQTLDKLEKYFDLKIDKSYEKRLHLHDKYRFLGATPDAMCFSKDKLAVLEIKSPLCLKENHMSEVQYLSKKSSLVKLAKNRVLQIRPNTALYNQLQLQMLVCKTELGYAAISVADGVCLMRIERDETFLAKTLQKVSHIWSTELAPRILEETNLEQESEDNTNDPDNIYTTGGLSMLCETTIETNVLSE